MDPGEELVRWLVLFGQLDGGMDEAVLLHMPVSVPAVGEDMAAGFDLVLEEAVHASGTSIREYRQRGKTGNRRPARLACGAVFDGHGDDGLALGAASLAGFAMLLATHVALVDFDQAAQLIALIAILHRLADLVLHHPGGAVADPDLLRQLHRRDALFVVAHAINCPEPARQWRARLVKDRARRHRTLVRTMGALMHLAIRHIPAAGAVASRTAKPVRPALPVQLLPATRLLAKQGAELLHRQHRETLFQHEIRLSPYLRLSKRHNHLELIGQIGEVQPHGNDEFAFVVGSQRSFFKRPSTHNLEVDEISRLRTFLREADVLGKPAKAHRIGRIVVVVDHHAAHIYHDLGGSLPEGQVTVKPYDPFGFERHLVHRKEAHYKGDHVPEEDSYYEEVAGFLVDAEAIVLIGHAIGKSSAVKFLSEYLKTHHPETFKRIIATETADLSALTEPEIEEIAKRYICPVTALSA